MFMSPFLRGAAIQALVRAGIDRGSAMMDSMIGMMAEGIHRQSWSGHGVKRYGRDADRSKYSPHQGKDEITRRIVFEAHTIERQEDRARAAGHDLSARMSRRGRLIDVA